MDGKITRHIRRAAKLNTAFGYLPYGWSEEKQAVTFATSRRSWAAFLFQIFLYWAFVASFRKDRQVECTIIRSKKKCKSCGTFMRHHFLAGTLNVMSNVVPIFTKPQAPNVITSICGAEMASTAVCHRPISYCGPSVGLGLPVFHAHYWIDVALGKYS